MTVCIAAICQFNNQPLIIGASDRMVSTPLIGAEPPKWKLQVLTDQIVISFAGVTNQQAGVLRDTVDAANLKAPLTVKDAADLYAQQFLSHRRIRAEREYLSPIGLNGLTFLNMNLSPELTARLINEMRECELEAEAIITGIDATGTHIYTVADPGIVSCVDLDGYAAIGVGALHAESEFMFRGYTGDWSYARALFLVYSAKKRAETAPEVGKHTDLFYIYPGLPPGSISEEMAKQVDSIYERTQDNREADHKQALAEMDKYAEEAFPKENSAEETKPPEGDGAHEKAISEGAEESQREDGKEA